MSLFAIADLHLSYGVDKPMDIFAGWQDYLYRLNKNWITTVKEQDTVVIPGDISWGIDLEQAKKDLVYLDQLPGTKILIKGNHDYWWPTKKKIEEFFEENDIHNLIMLYHDAFAVEDVAICGTRSWFYEEGDVESKVYKRELQRLHMSLESASLLQKEEIIVFLHYPPIYKEYIYEDFIDLLVQYGVKRCYYGHLHGPSINAAFNGEYKGIRFKLISSDSLRFSPLPIINYSRRQV